MRLTDKSLLSELFIPLLIGLLAFLNAQLYMPLRQIDLADALEFVGNDMSADMQWQMFNVLGAALRVEAKVL